MRASKHAWSHTNAGDEHIHGHHTAQHGRGVQQSSGQLCDADRTGYCHYFSHGLRYPTRTAWNQQGVRPIWRCRGGASQWKCAARWTTHFNAQCIARSLLPCKYYFLLEYFSFVRSCILFAGPVCTTCRCQMEDRFLWWLKRGRKAPMKKRGRPCSAAWSVCCEILS